MKALKYASEMVASGATPLPSVPAARPDPFYRQPNAQELLTEDVTTWQRGGRFQADFPPGKKYLGMFSTAEEAALAIARKQRDTSSE